MNFSLKTNVAKQLPEIMIACKKVSMIKFLFSVFFVRNGHRLLCKKSTIFVFIKSELLVYDLIFLNENKS